MGSVLTHSVLPPLDRPPIFEVACGVEFDPIRDIDPVLLGGFWREVRGEYPLRETHNEIPRLNMGFELVLGDNRPLRTWFVSANGEFVVQIQRDRFFLNWRTIGEDGRYPRFSSSSEGVLPRSVELFDKLSAFLTGAIGAAPHPRRVEVLKVDLLIEGRDWSGDDDLMTMMPILRQFCGFGPFQKPTQAFRLVEDLDGAGVELALETLPITPTQRHLRLTTTVRAEIALGESFASAATRAGKVANEVFGAVISKDECAKRFSANATGGPT